METQSTLDYKTHSEDVMQNYKSLNLEGDGTSSARTISKIQYAALEFPSVIAPAVSGMEVGPGGALEAASDVFLLWHLWLPDASWPSGFLKAALSVPLRGSLGTCVGVTDCLECSWGLDSFR
eukprot:IDg17939t1